MRKIFLSILLIVTIGCGENHRSDSGLGNAALREDNGYNQVENIDSISIYFSDKQFKKIVEKRERALYRGQLMSEAEDWVTASIIYLGDTLKAAVKLKGDLYDHWGHETEWSFKVKLKNGGVVKGMQRFAIQRPATRSFLNEWILHKLLKYNDLIALNYDFVKLTLNGKPFPVYAIEENFDKRLIERNELREGLTFRFDRGFFWYHDPGLNDAFYTCLIRPYQESKTLRTPMLREQYTIVRNLIEGFRKGDLKTSDVFDSEKLARGLALIDLTGHHHASVLENLKFYYNPITSLIEPIIYDNQHFLNLEAQGLLGEHKTPGERKEVLEATLSNSYWYQHLFNDEIFFRDYTQELSRISQKEFLDKFINSIEKSTMDKVNMLHLSYPDYEFSGYDVFYSNQEYIRQVINQEANFQISVKNNEGFFKSSHRFPVEVSSIKINNKEYLDNSIVVEAVSIDPSNTMGTSISSLKNIANLSPASKVIIEYQVLGSHSLKVAEYTLSDFLELSSPGKPIMDFSSERFAGLSQYDLQGLAIHFASIELMGSSKISDIASHVNSFSKSRSSGKSKMLLGQIKVKEHKNSIPSYELYGVRDYAMGTHQSILGELFRSQLFTKLYIRALEEVSSPNFVTKSKRPRGYRDLISIINGLSSDKRNVIAKNQRYLWKYLNPVKAIHIHFESIDLEQEKLFLRVSNTHKLPMEILEAVAYKDWVFFPQNNQVIEGTRENEIMKSEIIEFRFQKRFAALLKDYGAVKVELPWNPDMLQNLKINYRIKGATRSHFEKVLPFKRLDAELLSNDLVRSKINWETQNAFDLDADNNTVTVHMGSWDISADVRIPSGHTLVIEEGASINLVNGAMILSNSPIQAIGSEEHPIQFNSTDGTGQGLAIISSGGRSKFDYVSFSNLTSPSKNGWVLSGAVNFYESDVDISNFSFSLNSCEDALNIIRSSYTLSNGVFSDIHSDALDLDFSSGSVRNVRLERIGNDALDVAGGDSNYFSNIKITTTGDKGISIGEGGIVVGEEIYISGAEISVGVKDRSNANFSGLFLEDCTLGFAAFQKKPEYGGSKTTVQNLKLDNVSKLYLLEDNSQLIIDQKNLAPNCENVNKQLNGITYGKSSKSAVRP